MIVLRVEHSGTMKGPYRHGVDVDWRASVDEVIEDSPVRHPIPADEGLPLSEFFVFGFRDPVQMYTWFREEVLSALWHLDNAFVISFYDVAPERVHGSGRQVTFFRGRTFETAVEMLVKPIASVPASTPRGLVERAWAGAI